jgi:hypothetical protein
MSAIAAASAESGHGGPVPKIAPESCPSKVSHCDLGPRRGPLRRLAVLRETPAPYKREKSRERKFAGPDFTHGRRALLSTENDQKV